MKSIHQFSKILAYCLIFAIAASFLVSSATSDHTFGGVTYDSDGVVVGTTDVFSSTTLPSSTLGGVTYDSEGHVLDTVSGNTTFSESSSESSRTTT